MMATRVQSGFRTLAHLSRGPAPLGDPRRPSAAAAEPWVFEATVDRADAVFLVVEEAGRASRWSPMERLQGRLWSLTLPLSPAHLRAKLYAQRGTTMIHCGGGDLVIRPPADASGRVRVDAAQLAWSA